MGPKNKVLISNQTDKIELPQDIILTIENLAQEVLRKEDVRESELSITFVDNKTIRTLNANYRNKDEVTDVLSFPIDEELLGEVIISLPVAKVQAEEYNHSLKREICFLIVHGILHILGYDHIEKKDREKMRKLENEIMEEAGINRD
ncbi:MAG: rRNA maturation RNase YbeY [Bacillota bacterium]